MISCFLALLQNFYEMVDLEVTETTIRVTETNEQAIDSTHTMNETRKASRDRLI